MNNDEARFLLHARRPNGADDQDPAMQAALAQAARDPELGAWLAREQALDAAVSRHLNAITPPADLRAQLLAGASLQPRRRSRRSTVKRPAWRSPWLALAASLALIVSAALLRIGLAPSSLESLQARAFDESRGHHSGYVLASQLGRIGRWLQNPANSLTAGLPGGYEGLRAQGCRRLSVAGREVLEVCFWRGEKEYHLYIARRADFPVERDAPTMDRDGSLIAATWADADNVYVLATKHEATAFNGLL